MSCEESQLEEIEVLKSIYDGDDRFKLVEQSRFQYKVGDNDSVKSFVIEFVWGPDYPDVPPVISLDVFYNNHIIKEVKECIVRSVLDEALQNVGCAMTYTLIEWTKENVDLLLREQPMTTEVDDCTHSLESLDIKPQVEVLPKEKKTQLSKAQKRKMFSAVNERGEKPRGWDWVDVVKHLTQSGSSAASSNSQQLNNPVLP